MRKVSAIICATIIICSLIVIPCVAVGVYPTQSNTFSGIQTLNPVEGWTFENCTAVAEIVENAYKLNYFGAGVPIAIVRANNSIAVLVVPYVNDTFTGLPIRPSNASPIYDGYVPPEIGDSRNEIIGTVIGTTTTYIKATNANTGEFYPMLLYFFNEENTFFPSNAVPILTQYNAENALYNEYEIGLIMLESYREETSRIIAIRYGNNDWRTPYAQGYSDINIQINSIKTWYENQLTPTIINNTYEYQLDIPGIITAIPNGAKQIINNAFGFEIFGINVAGLLSVLLVVAIVAFIVKWLMSR